MALVKKTWEQQKRSVKKLAKIDDKNPYNLSVRIDDSRLDLFFIFLFLFLFLFI